MKRKCILVGYPGEIGKKGYCEGVLKDFINYQRFLSSPLGGAWKNEEIIPLQTKSKSEVLTHIRGIKNDEYLLFIFCGHGYFNENIKQTVIQLNSSEEISENDVMIAAFSRLYIFDCCRKTIAQMNEDSALFEEAIAKTASTLNGVDCRRYYDDQIMKCQGQTTKTFGCDITEESGDDSRFGGYYSSALIDTVKDMYKRSNIDTTLSYKILQIDQIHKIAKIEVAKRTKNEQNPQICKARSDIQLPFGIIA
jgi:hypothetical protein